MLSAALGHEHVSRRVWLGVLAACAGIVLVVGSASPDGGAGETLFGDLLLLGGTVAWAFYTVGCRDLIRRYGAVCVTAWTLWVGSAAIIIAGLPATIALDFGTFTWHEWLAIGYAGALSIGVAYMIWSYGVRHLGNTRTSAYSNLVPVFGVLVAWTWLGERPGAGQLAGAAIIIAGVMLTQATVSGRAERSAAVLSHSRTDRRRRR
jgi:drug/metabolite transporter (DMT)-like permease